MKKESWKCVVCGERMSIEDSACTLCRTSMPEPLDSSRLRLNANPWYNRRKIQCSGDIYGRDKVAEEIYAIIGAQYPGSVSLIGDRKIGKSSLLHYIADPLIVEKHMRLGNIAAKGPQGRDLRLFFVQIDACQTPTLTTFYNEVVKQLAQDEQGREFVTARGPSDPSPLEAIVCRMEEEGARLVIMVDEAELLVTGGEDPADARFKRRLDASSFTDLKMLCDHFDVAFVTATEKGLAPVLDSSSNIDVRAEANRFDATFEKVRVLPLDPDAAEELILEPARRVGLLEEFEEYKDFVLDVAGRFPLLIQIACSVLFKNLIKNRRRALEHAELERQFMIDADTCFAGILETFTEEEMQICAAVVQGSAVSRTGTFRSLVERGYLETGKGDHVRLFSRIFASYLASKLYEEETEISAKWVELPHQPKIGPWVLEHKLGEGGIGRVYCARHEVLNKVRAIKVLNPDQASDQKFLEQFKSQARLWFELSEEKPHRNIVRIDNIDSAGEYHYLEMELVKGKDLSRHIEKEPLNEERCLGIAIQITEAIRHYWQHSHLIHRDIKPRNILIDEQADGLAKLSDFDLAVALPDTSAKRRNTQIVGTRDYMAPEQLSSTGDVDIRADIYSLGITIFEAATGKLPREVSDQFALGISKTFKAVMTKMTQHDREDRHRTPSELLEDLYAVKKGECPPHSLGDESTDTAFS